MGKLFGTDGIRGVANETLTCHLAYRVGQAAAISLGSFEGKRPKVVIGKDTRISSDMLEAALLAGLTASGCDAVKLGVIPTPAVAYSTVREHADAGIVISASHNPFEHNGIKMFSSRGFKLSDELEANIESLILQEGELSTKTHGEIGRITDGAGLMDAYLDHLASTVNGLKPIRVVFDCANGAASATARKLFSRFPLEATYLSADPDGVNINDGCGSTHLGKLAKAVVDGGYDLGLAFDGDADRCLAVDENGTLIDGDQVMAACGMDLMTRGKLPGNAVVATVMSNLGLHVFAKENGLKVECTDVGDRNVLERMVEKGYVLGGEQSGHMIFLDYATTGDGQLTALQVLALLKESGKKASEVFGACPRYPQVLINIPVADNDVKKAVMASPLLAQAIQQEEAALGDDGRVLVRPSGTEALMRVMVEAKTQSVAQETAQRLADLIAGL